jgi:tetratricopeptide (TPR) repeat protein
MAYYIAVEIPNYEQAHSYARELEHIAEQSRDIKAELAQFYVSWSTAVKMKRELDPLKEMVRQQKYKELADRALTLLHDIALDTHEWHHLLAQSYYNLWDYDRSLIHVDEAIDRLPRNSHLYAPYCWFRREILRKQTFFR